MNLFKVIIIFTILTAKASFSFSQSSLEDVFKKYNKGIVPFITVVELASASNDMIILDTREPNEYHISYIKNAIPVGFNHFNINQFIENHSNKEQEIVVYCSIGVRSEIIGEKLQKAGYSNVKNLYGGIFEWKNNNFPVYNLKNKETDSVHAYSKEWSKWLKKGIKVYE